LVRLAQGFILCPACKFTRETGAMGGKSAT